MVANPNAFKDAESTSDSTRNAQIFTDINLNLVKHPVTGDIAKLSNVEAVKRSVRNLINTNKGERPFHPEIGSDIRKALFEPMSSAVSSSIKTFVRDLIETYEPRAELVSVDTSEDFDNNTYNVTITFFLINSPSGVQSMNILLERLR
tara:strand:- start:3531 stop:3974 length:444 start_codon:yes stop_codon:yes gene_type:complete